MLAEKFADTLNQFRNDKESLMAILKHYRETGLIVQDVTSDDNKSILIAFADKSILQVVNKDDTSNFLIVSPENAKAFVMKLMLGLTDKSAIIKEMLKIYKEKNMDLPQELKDMMEANNANH